ncbi:hypothetical protein ACHAWF_015091 [Thalassiosira exigua]
MVPPISSSRSIGCRPSSAGAAGSLLIWLLYLPLVAPALASSRLGPLAAFAATRFPPALANSALDILDDLDRLATQADSKENLAGWHGVPSSDDDEEEGGEEEVEVIYSSDDPEDDSPGNECLKRNDDGTCRIYSNVQHFYNDFGELEFRFAGCDKLYGDNLEDFEVVAAEDSLYQKVMFEENLKNEDKCLFLDRTMQQCSSYRPHYHEPFVHFSAAYLNRGMKSGVKRVVFVGGGDSMLLHEILKYDSLELVLGLELDQKVTRNSFEHFKTQPHFDDPRVQWWFGDGAKSLTLLPREYFGTFDLVLLDLSETVMSMTVTKGLDVFGAMKLLLSPTGVLVKNDFGYFEQLSKVFDTCMQLLIPAVYICDFELVLCGSDKVDFLDPSFVHMKGAADGQVETLMYKPHVYLDDHWGPMTDFSKYWGEPRQCLDGDAPVDEEAIAHAGILMIVEAENVSTQLNDVAEAAETFEGILRSLGYNVLKSTTSYAGPEEGATFVVAMEEGYVLADTWPDSKYCKLDIHLWGKFERQEDIRTGLLEALGSKDGDWQSYRIVTGGMHGCATRKEDLKRTGPDLAKIGQCEPEEEGSRRSIVPNSSYADEPALGPVIDAGLTDIIAMMIGEKISVLNAVVFCGAKDQPCRAKSNMEKQGFANLMTLWSCSDKEKTEVEASPHLLDQALAQFQYFLDHESIEEFTVCGIKSDAVLLRLTKKIGSISVLVVDALAPSLYVQGSQEYLDKNTKYITKPSLLLVPILDDADNARVSFLRSRYNRGKVEPEYYSEMLVGDGNKVMSFGMIHEGNADSIQGLIHAQDRLNQEGAVKFTDIRRVTIRGAIRKQNDFDPVLFSWNDYDQRPGLEQFYSQKAVGFQTVFQLKEELGAEADMMSRGEVERAFKSAVRRIWQNADDIVEAVNEVGDGLLLAALSSGGQVVMTWDGADGINVNIFTYAEDVDHHQSFVSPLTDSLTPMSLILQDEQPRGHNKVMTKSDRVDHDESPDCYDHYRMCEVFSENGACTKGDNTKEWTKKHCKFSCKHCDKESLTAKSEL